MINFKEIFEKEDETVYPPRVRCVNCSYLNNLNFDPTEDFLAFKEFRCKKCNYWGMEDYVLTPSDMLLLKREIELSSKAFIKAKKRREYYLKNKERTVEISKAYYKKNKNKINSYNKKAYHRRKGEVT